MLNGSVIKKGNRPELLKDKILST